MVIFAPELVVSAQTPPVSGIPNNEPGKSMTLVPSVESSQASAVPSIPASGKVLTVTNAVPDTVPGQSFASVTLTKV